MPGPTSWLENQLNSFWEWSVSLVPLWVSPNLLTLFGFTFAMIPYWNMLYYEIIKGEEIPSYCFFLSVFCFFMYNTMDYIDGKQARRTKSSSPLGQLFDHGSDSFSEIFYMSTFCQALNCNAT